MQFSPQGGNGTVFAPSDVVPVTGIEPVRLSSRDFKSRASAGSATLAYDAIYNIMLWIFGQAFFKSAN